MITAVDSSVLLDVFIPDPRFGPRSRSALASAAAEGALVACEVVWAEVSAAFQSPDLAAYAFAQLGLAYSALGERAAVFAGQAWKSHRRRGNRTRVVADFLIGAHAAVHAERLLTRDRGFFARYFSELVLLDPSRA